MSLFGDPEIVKRLQTQFIPLALDLRYALRRKDEAGDFLRQVVAKSPRAEDFKSGKPMQGMYCFAADGEFLGLSDNHTPPQVQRLMDRARADFRPKKVEVKLAGAQDKDFLRLPPEGGLVLDVFSHVPGKLFSKNPELRPENRWLAEILDDAVGRDHMWLTKKELEELLPGSRKSYPVPNSVIHRLARFHLVDNTRGFHAGWREDEVRSATMSITVESKSGRETRLRLDGEVHLLTAVKDRGYDVRLLGYLVAQEGGFRRLEIVAKGSFWGEGAGESGARGAPKGKFPLLVAFSLAGDSDWNQIPPEAARKHQPYIPR